jgi:hypothetical protein
MPGAIRPNFVEPKVNYKTKPTRPLFSTKALILTQIPGYPTANLPNLDGVCYDTCMNPASSRPAR